MTKDIFTKYVQELVLPLFTGSSILGEEESSSRDSEVAQGNAGTMLVKPHKEDVYRLIIKRSQAFKNADIELMRAIIDELDQINEYNISDEAYLSRLQKIAMEKAICRSLTNCATSTLLGVIAELDSCARKTYEGRRIKFGIIINEFNLATDKTENTNYRTLFKKDFFAVMSNGQQSCLEFDKDGNLISHIFFEKQRFVPTITPYDYTNVAKYCSDKKIGVVLLESGEILLFKNHELMFCKKRGTWGSYCHDEIIQLLSNRTTHTIKEIRKAIYFTALDCSFAGSGGCIVYLNNDELSHALTHIDINDILDENSFNIKKNQMIDEATKLYNMGSELPIDPNISFNDYLEQNKLIKSTALKECIDSKKFQELNRKLREEIVGIDGATIIDSDGTIVACGAIIQIEAGSTGGGRLAATKTLAKYGVSIKISADGIMQAYVKDRKNKEVKPIFTLG